MRKTITQYLNRANKAEKQYNKIRLHALRPEPDLYNSNEKRGQGVTLLQG